MTTSEYYLDIIERISREYPSAVGPDDCSLADNHACPKCEIYYLLNEAIQYSKDKSKAQFCV